MACLFVTALRVEVQPHDVTSLGYIAANHQNASLPTTGPKLTSACKFSGVMTSMQCLSPWDVATLSTVGMSVQGAAR